MRNDRKYLDNQKALNAKSDESYKNRFLSQEQDHILHLVARILKTTVSMSDDEWSVALIATGEAIDSYDEGRGDFWNYAALVIGSRLKDYYKSSSKRRMELLTSPDAFGSEMDEDESTGLQIEVREKTAVVVDTRLRDELDAFEEEISSFGITLFDIPGSAPRTSATKALCAKILKAFFVPPPPLTGEMKRTGKLPAGILMDRTGCKRKFIDKHRKYLIAGAVIKAGDYPGLAEYLPGTDDEDQE